MQPRILALIITLLPLLVANAVYLLSAYQGYVAWCNPYLDGCTTISQAARSGDSIYLFRATMIAYAVLLIWFWVYAAHWLKLLYGHTTKTARVILWLGVIGALSLIIYIDYLGTTGEVNRFMRRYGIMVFFTFTPLAQLLLLKQHFETLASKSSPKPAMLKPRVLRFQLIVLLSMLVIGLISSTLEATHNKTYESENIVEWIFSLLLNLYFLGMVTGSTSFLLSFSPGLRVVTRR